MPNTKSVGIAYSDPQFDEVTIPAVLVAALPAAATSQGMRRTVSNSSAAFTAGIGAVVAGGGANVVPVFSDGTNWRIG